MKKLAFTFVLLLSFACSKDDNSNSNNQVDPIIGSWQSSFTLTDETEEGEVVNISADGTIIFNADGTGSRNLLITTDGGEPQESNETLNGKIYLQHLILPKQHKIMLLMVTLLQRYSHPILAVLFYLKMVEIFKFQ